MANNSEILGEEAAVRQIVENDFSATDGHFEDDTVNLLRGSSFNGKSFLTSASFPNLTAVSGISVFNGCSNLETINLPLFNSNIYSNMFCNCAKLRKIILPSFTKETGQEAFRGCSKLILLDLCNCTKLSGKNLVYGCPILVAIVLRKSAACTLGSTNVFDNSKYATSGAGGVYVYVPRALISTYQSATNWATLYAAHNDMFRALEDYTVDGTTTGDFDESKL